MKKKFIFIFISLFSAVIFFSCKKDKDAYNGPLLCPTNSFAYTQPFAVSASTIDLNAAKLNLSAEYNEELDWTVVITGLTSGATKTFTGRAKVVDIDWAGNADMGPFFITETCKIEFTLACRDAITTTVDVTPNHFMTYGKLMNDFDGYGSYPAFGSSTYGLYLDAAQSGIKNTPVPASPQGGNYYRLVGNSAGVPVWGFGGFSSAVSLTSLGENDPKKVYFNIFLHSNGKTNSDISITFTEGGSSKAWRVTATWSGWKMVSFPLSDAGIIEASKVTAMEIYLGSSPIQTAEGEINLDFPIYTTNHPYYY